MCNCKRIEIKVMVSALLRVGDSNAWHAPLAGVSAVSQN